jgi:putative IMPACT (imprinted ancient) family translation regulator
MGTRSVRLDEETEKSLAKLTKMTGLSISEVLKQGVRSFKAKAMNEQTKKPYDVYKGLDLGSGGYSRAEAKHAKTAVAGVIKKKHGK